MMKNNKGLTLVELLAVIVLISLLLGLGIPGINRIRENMNKKALNTKIGLIEQAGVLWGQDNKTMLQKDGLDGTCNLGKDSTGTFIKCYKILLKDLIEDDYLDSENYNSITYKNPRTDEDMIDKSCYVSVYKKNNRVYAYFNDETNCPG